MGRKSRIHNSYLGLRVRSKLIGTNTFTLPYLAFSLLIALHIADRFFLKSTKEKKSELATRD